MDKPSRRICCQCEVYGIGSLDGDDQPRVTITVNLTGHGIRKVLVPLVVRPRANGLPVPGPAPNREDPIATVIDPAAMPSGTELFFGYFSNVHAVFTDLVYTSSYTCSNGPPPPVTH